MIQKIANSLGVFEPVNGSWLCGIVDELGGDLENDLWLNWAKTLSITEPVNGTWIEAIARHYGATEPFNGTWIAAILNVVSPYWELNYTDVDYIVNS